MADITIKRGDTWPKITATLEQFNEETGKYEAIPLAGVEHVKINMKSADGSVLIEGTCTVTNAAKGEVSYTWGLTDTAYASLYSVEFEINWTSTEIQTVPNSGVRQILIEPEVGHT